MVKRSLDEVKAWLVRTDNGLSVPDTAVALYDEHGQAQIQRTGADGIATFAVTDRKQKLWLAARGEEPAFARAPAPAQEKPFLIYMYADRPIYRPGQLVHFRGTVRAVQRGVYSLPKEKSVQVQIKTRGDAVVYAEKLALNDYGSFNGEFQLAPEPPLGSYTLEVTLAPDEREYYSFEVQAYRKPEFDVSVTMAKPYYLGSTTVPVTIAANYFFGSPVSGAKVKYTVNFDQTGEDVPERILTAAGLFSAAQGSIEPNFGGQGRLDAHGKLEVRIPTRSLPFDREVNVSAEVEDLSLRSRSAGASTLITAAQFRLSLALDQDQYLPGDSVEVSAKTLDYGDKPVSAPLTITLVEQMLDRLKRPYEVRTKHTVTTNKDGRGTVRFKVVRPGDFYLEAWSRDSQGNAVYAETDFQVVTKKLAPSWPTLETALDKENYAPGDTALLHVRTSLLGLSALLTIEGERLYRCAVYPLAGKDFVIKIPVTHAYQPGVDVHLLVISAGRKLESSVQLAVPMRQKKLSISLIPSKSGYQPGEKATFAVTVRDANGRGVPAELGLGVVDTALYAVMPDTTPSPYDVLWQPQADRVETDYSLAATYPGGGYQHIPAPTPPSGQPQGIRVRKLFVDTACWAPALLTDRDGRAEVSFTVPDNLTTWRATARGLTAESAAGAEQMEVKVTLPLLVRLTVPRFYVRNDEGVVAAIVHNYTGVERKTQVTLSADGALLDSATEQTITLPADGIQRLTWKVKITGVTGGTPDHVRFLLSADGGDGARDAMESTLPVFPDGVQRVAANAGKSSDSAAIDLTLPANTVPGSANVDVAISPSLAGPIFEALDYLVDYPYGCAEQAMSSFLPDIIVTRTLHELGVQRPEPPLLKRYVSFGLQKLLRYQHQDGGWHWWEFDQSDPYMTAYVIYGLSLARDAGYPLAAGPLPRGVDYLRRALHDEQDRTAAAYLLLALVSADSRDADTLDVAESSARRLITERKKLDIFSRASLLLALHRLNRQQPHASFAEAEKLLAAELEAAAVHTGTAVHWTANAAGGGSWLDSDVEVTAQVLQALLAAKPGSPTITPAVSWLMAARQGKAWNSTKDTASAVLALTAYLKTAKELSPNESVTVSIGAHELRTLTFTAHDVFNEPVHLTIPAADLQPGANAVRLAKTGAGNLYWSAHLRYVLPAEGLAPQANGIHLKREYRVLAEDPVGAGTQSIGSLVEVTVTLTCDHPYRYAMLQEPVPAGCEIVGGDDEPQRRYGQDESDCDHQEQWDDRLVYYFDYLQQGEQTISYWLRTESPGSFRIRPGTAELVYFPEVRGEERLVRMKVEAEP